MNPLKNEMTLSLGGREILLRPTFENMVTTETKVGSIANLAWRLTQLAPPTRHMLGMSEMTMIVFYMQAANDKTLGEKALTLEEVYDLCMSAGVSILVPQLLAFLGKVTAGNKSEPTVSESLKKN